MTIVSIIALIVALVAFLYAGRTHGLAGRSQRTRFLLLGGGTLLAGILIWLLALLKAAPEFIVLLVGLLLIGCLWVTAALVVSLCAYRVGRAGWVFIGLAVSAAALICFLADDLLPPALVLLPLTLRTPWLQRTTGFRLRLSLLGASLFVLVFHGSRLAGIIPELGGLLDGLIHLGLACLLSYAGALTLKLLLYFPGKLFDLLKLRARLVISYMLVGGPVLLVTVLLFVLALAVIGGHRSALIANLTAPPAHLRAVAAAVLDDPELPGILRAPAEQRHPGFDLILRRHLTTLLGTASLEPRADPAAPGEEIFILAGLRDLADTTRMFVSAGPHGLAPAGAAALLDLIPPCPFDGFVLVDSLLYSTHGLERETPDHQRLVQICRRVTPAMLESAAELSAIQFMCVFTDSASISASDAGLHIQMNDAFNELRFASPGFESETRGPPIGAQLLTVHRIAGADTLANLGGILLVRTEWDVLLASIFDTVRNPLNGVILILLIVIAGLILLVELIAIPTGATIARNIHRAIIQLTRGTRRLAEDDLDHRLGIRRGDELGELGQAFNAMAEGLKERRRLVVEQERLLSELQVAHDIQQRMLPAGIPAMPGLDVAGLSLPSREVGGDGYDFLRWGETQLAVSIADVSGKGVPAALLMSNLQASVRAHARRPAPLRQVVTELNQLIAASTDPERFITFFLAVIEPIRRRLCYVNAGHNPPLLVRHDGRLERLTEGGILLGAFPEAEYQSEDVHLTPGDTLVLYTDGVVEAQRGPDDYFEDDRLEDLLSADLSDLSAAAIRDRIVTAVQEFAGDAEQSDDITVVVVRCLEIENQVAGATAPPLPAG